MMSKTNKNKTNKTSSSLLYGRKHNRGDMDGGTEDEEIKKAHRRRSAIRYTTAGIEFFRKNKCDRAKWMFQKSIAEGSQNYSNFYYKSRSEYALDELDEANVDGRRAVMLAPKDDTMNVVKYKCHSWMLQMKLSIGDLEFCKKFIERMKQYYRRTVSKDFSVMQSKFTKLSRYMKILSKKKHSYEKQMKFCRKALKIAPKCAKLHLVQATAFLNCKKYVEGRSAAVTALKFKNDYPEAKHCRFRCIYLSCSISETKGVLTALLEENADDKEYRDLLNDIESLDKEMTTAKNCVNDRNYAAFRGCLTNCLTIISSSDLLKHDELEAKLWLKIGAAHVSEGNNADALVCCKKATSFAIKLVEAFILKGDIEMENEHFSDAYDSYKIAIDLDYFRYFELKSKMDHALSIAEEPSYYRMLGIKSSATPREIKVAYKAGVLKYHPDKNPGASEFEKQRLSKFFNSVKESYDTLSDPIKKTEYDSNRQEKFLIDPDSIMAILRSDFK